MTDWLRTPTGTRRLKSIQARALLEAADTGRLVGQIVAGGGKFLISALLPTVLGAKRTLLLVPAHLQTQTHDEWVKWSPHFRLPILWPAIAAATDPVIRVMSYSKVSSASFGSFLEQYDPDLIITDEAHCLARLKSARSRKIFRHLKARRKAGARVPFVPLSGSIWSKSFRECAHLLEAALDDGSPLPREYPDLEQWCYALDEGVRDDARIDPGALWSLCNDEEKSQGLDGVRRAFRRRLVETPGIVATTESGIDTSLVLQARPIEVPPKVVEAIKKLRTEFALPNGDTFDGGIVAWNHARELGNGFYYRWDPPGPPEWMKARKAWATFVQAAMDSPPKGVGHLDSPLMVWNAVSAGKFGTVPEWNKWRDIRGTFEPNPVPTWLSDFLVKDAEEWALANDGIVWVGHSSAFTKEEGFGDDADTIGRAFARIPYFGAGKSGDGIRDHKGPCVASIAAHGTGKNLHQWSKALLLSSPSSGKAMEQLLARHHREGQTADEVHVSFYLHTREAFEAIRNARRQARYIRDINGNSQRILDAVVMDVDGHSFDEDKYEAKIDRATRSGTDPAWSRNSG